MAGTSSLSVRLQTALSHPQLGIRCEEVARILAEVTTKDAGHILRATVESILGVALYGTMQGQMGWGLRLITRSAQPREFEQLRAFLGPGGPLLTLVFRLASDPYMAFEFPLAWLPAKSRMEIEEGSPSGFYSNKVQYPGPGKVPVNILLNSFEYYIFQFAHFLIGSTTTVTASPGSTSGNVLGQRLSLSWSSAGDALYPTLLEDYLTAFLPCDGSHPPGPPSPPASPRGVLAPRSGCTGSTTLYQSGLAASPTLRPLYHSFPEGMIGSGMVPGVPFASSPLQQHHHAPLAVTSPHGSGQPSNSVWTSQVLIQVLIEIWVNQCVVPSLPPRTTVTNSSTSTTPRPYFHATAATSATTTTASQEVFVPTSDHVRLVRMVVKHLHFFANSGKAAQPSPLDSLRKNVWNLYRKSVYQFLVHTFKHWPLDSSFRLVLETWLSYIQPWRYCDYTPTARSPANTQTSSSAEIESRTVEGRWQGFVAENLLFYSLLFHHLLLRLFRLDLSAPRNAQILFRVTKVFSQPNLSRYIQEIESALEDPHLIHHSLLGHTTTTNALGHRNFGGGGPNGLVDARSLASLARSHCVEMEGLGHSYQPMFGAASHTLINSLMKHVHAAYEAVCSEQQQQHQQQTQVQSGVHNDGTGHKSGWWRGLIRSLFESSVTPEDEAGAEDMRKTIVHLEMAQRHLATMFGVAVPSQMSYFDGSSRPYHSPHTDSTMYHHHHHTLDSPAEPEQVQSPNGPVLTAYGRHQLLNGLRRRDLKYEGDPDLRPIGTFEVAWLVRWLYALSVLINAKYGERMASVYSCQDVVGWLARRVLQAPETIYEYHKDLPGAPPTRLERHLPPRVSLRTQANKRVLGYELTFLLLLHLLGFWGLMLRLLAGTVLFTAVVGFLVQHYIQAYHTTNTTTTPDTCITSAPATYTTPVKSVGTVPSPGL